MRWKPPQLNSLRGSDAVPLRQILLHLSDFLDGLGGPQAGGGSDYSTFIEAPVSLPAAQGTIATVAGVPAGSYDLTYSAQFVAYTPSNDACTFVAKAGGNTLRVMQHNPVPYSTQVNVGIVAFVVPITIAADGDLTIESKDFGTQGAEVSLQYVRLTPTGL